MKVVMGENGLIEIYEADDFEARMGNLLDQHLDANEKKKIIRGLFKIFGKAPAIYVGMMNKKMHLPEIKNNYARPVNKDGFHSLSCDAKYIHNDAGRQCGNSKTFYFEIPKNSAKESGKRIREINNEFGSEKHKNKEGKVHRNSIFKSEAVLNKKHGFYETQNKQVANEMVEKGFKAIPYENVVVVKSSTRGDFGIAIIHIDYLHRPGANGEEVEGGNVISNIGDLKAQRNYFYHLEKEHSNGGERPSGIIQYRLILELPYECTPEKRIYIMETISEEFFGKKGLPYVAVVHKEADGGDKKNQHGHIDWHDRKYLIDENGKKVPSIKKEGKWVYGEKYTEHKKNNWLNKLKIRICELNNEVLVDTGEKPRFSHLSNEKLGIPKKPGEHLTIKENYLERNGVPTFVGINNYIKLKEYQQHIGVYNIDDALQSSITRAEKFLKYCEKQRSKEDIQDNIDIWDFCIETCENYLSDTKQQIKKSKSEETMPPSPPIQAKAEKEEDIKPSNEINETQKEPPAEVQTNVNEPINPAIYNELSKSFEKKTNIMADILRLSEKIKNPPISKKNEYQKELNIINEKIEGFKKNITTRQREIMEDVKNNKGMFDKLLKKEKTIEDIFDDYKNNKVTYDQKTTKNIEECLKLRDLYRKDLEKRKDTQEQYDNELTEEQIKQQTEQQKVKREELAEFLFNDKDTELSEEEKNDYIKYLKVKEKPNSTPKNTSRVADTESTLQTTHPYTVLTGLGEDSSEYLSDLSGVRDDVHFSLSAGKYMSTNPNIMADAKLDPNRVKAQPIEDLMDKNKIYVYPSTTAELKKCTFRGAVKDKSGMLYAPNDSVAEKLSEYTTAEARDKLYRKLIKDATSKDGVKPIPKGQGKLSENERLAREAQERKNNKNKGKSR